MAALSMRMRRARIFLLSIFLSSQVAADEMPTQLTSQGLTPLPMAVSNNAVTAVNVQGNEYLVTFAGLGQGKTHDDTLSETLVFDSNLSEWRRAKPLPGGTGRLAATAATIGDRAFVFGGYSVAADGSEVSTPRTYAFDPVSGDYERRADMPVPVDDSVAVSYRGRFIYLVSGWHDFGNVNLTQRYDSESDSWSQATPIPGTAVFGHSGGIVGNRIVYCDGVGIKAHADRRREYVATTECYIGTIDEADGRQIDWRKIDSHPGKPRYRAAAVGMDDIEAILLLGGSDNPYNYNGIGYDGESSRPTPGGLLFDLGTMRWTELDQANRASMDHRALVPFGDAHVTIGGMLDGQRVTDQVVAYHLTRQVDGVNR